MPGARGWRQPNHAAASNAAASAPPSSHGTTCSTSWSTPSSSASRGTHVGGLRERVGRIRLVSGDGRHGADEGDVAAPAAMRLQSQRPDRLLEPVDEVQTLRHDHERAALRIEVARLEERIEIRDVARLLALGEEADRAVADEERRCAANHVRGAAAAVAS